MNSEIPTSHQPSQDERQGARKTRIRQFLAAGIIGIALAFAIGALLVSIATRKEAAKHTLPALADLDDNDVRPERWGRAFPAQYASFLSMAENTKETPFGGSIAYSRLIRYPQLTRLWSGYPFAADFNEERSHVYAQLDQVETKRNDTEWLQNHGFPQFKGQPGACMNCHSGWTPSLIREMGWEKFNANSYTDTRNKLLEKHGTGLHAANLGSTCADCHSPKDMSLRVTRPAYINAMQIRGYKTHSEKGIDATPQEMRSHVCQQCHVEYYFKGENKELVFPWSLWPKGEPLKIEQIESHYEVARKSNSFEKDWTHKETGAPMLKAQHPETELSSSGIHARSGVACADCHMPYMREGARKITNHNITSPLAHVRESCQNCHPGSEQNLRDRVAIIQTKTASQLRTAESAILALADDIVSAKALIEKSNKTDKVDSILSSAREAHRVASFRWDFIASENSTGFHSPQEAARVLGLSTDAARQGQLALVGSLAAEGLLFTPTVGSGKIPAAGLPIPEHKGSVGIVPSKRLSDCDAGSMLDCTEKE
jgi:nitrite reductase (cytochrome c-552)